MSNQNRAIVAVAAVVVGAILLYLALGRGDGDADASPSASVAASESAAASEPPASPSEAQPSATEVAEACTPETLETLTAGQLTIGTDNPAFPPYWDPPTDDEEPTDPWELGDPYNQRGFEGAVAWAIAEELGFAEDAVSFVPVPFDNSFAPGEKEFDFYLAQVSFAEDRATQVDMSDGYFFSNQALVANAETPITDVTSIADVAEFRLGVQAATTALTYVEEQIQPTQDPMVYSSNTDAITALNAGQIDGIVVDLPTAFFITAVQMDNGVVVGQFPAVGDEQEYFSLVLELDSPLTDCVNQAIAALDESGELEEITTEWMSENAGAPVLE
jgi:polar amino acid transport system substrate-binding protein